MTSASHGENPSDADRLIQQAITGARELNTIELQEIISNVAKSKFDPANKERAGGRLSGLNWQSHTIRGRDMLPPAEVHYLRHVIAEKQWPEGTTLEEYIKSIQEAIQDPMPIAM